MDPGLCTYLIFSLTRGLFSIMGSSRDPIGYLKHLKCFVYIIYSCVFQICFWYFQYVWYYEQFLSFRFMFRLQFRVSSKISILKKVGIRKKFKVLPVPPVRFMAIFFGYLHIFRYLFVFLVISVFQYFRAFRYFKSFLSPKISKFVRIDYLSKNYKYFTCI